MCDWCGDVIWPGQSRVALVQTAAGLRKETVCDTCWEEVIDHDYDEDDYPYDMEDA